MPLFPLTILLEVDELDRRFEIEATQTAGDAVLAYMQAHAALYGAADGLYPGVATIRMNMTDWRVIYGWRARAVFMRELEAALHQAAQVAADVASAVGIVDGSTVLAPADGDAGQYWRDQTLKASLLQRGIFCPEVGFFSVPDAGWRVTPTTAALIDATPERFGLVTLGLALRHA